MTETNTSLLICAMMLAFQGWLLPQDTNVVEFLD